MTEPSPVPALQALLADAGRKILEQQALIEALEQRIQDMKTLPYMAWGVKSGLTGRIYWHTTEEGARKQMQLKAPHGTTLVRKSEIIEDIE